ncbi:MAG: Cna B-type domain-containing protein, partial [Acutalibacteraceae bacterium]|nr:Cna B-type domain-containing protein [Acutalibacteraceae bacterium]
NKGEATTGLFTVGGYRFGYEGTCKLDTDDDGNMQFNIKNTLPVVSFTAEKVWDDENNRDYARHDSIGFTLTRGDDTYNVWTDKVKTATATGWNVDFGTYPQYSYTNTEYTYSVSENLPNSPRYVVQDVTGNPQKTGTNTHYVFTNKLDVTEKKLTVHKIWDDVGYKDTIRPTDLSNVKIELYSPDVVQSNSGSSQKVNDDDATIVNGIKSHIEAKQTANNTTAYNDLTPAEKLAFITNIWNDLTAEEQTAYNALTDDDEKAAQVLTWYQAAHPYVYQPALVQFTADSTNPNYESTYVFDHLPVYMNVDGTATEAGTQSNWKAIRYYVVETFEVNGHVYQTKYSLTYDDDYTATASDAGTTLTNNGLSNPADKIIYVKNTPVTRDILVTKEWNDQYYGDSTNTDKVTNLSRNLHYAKTAITLEGTSVLTQGEAATTVYPATTMYLAKANTDPTVTADYKGLVFKNVPIYDRNGNVIDYKVTESKDNETDAVHAPATDTQLAKPDDGDWAEPANAQDNDKYYTYGAKATAATTGNKIEFVQLTGQVENSNPAKYYNEYGYVGSAEKYSKTVTLQAAEGNNSAVTATYPTRYHITDTLPLTSVKAEKHWDDQDNTFGLRPTDIKDINKGENDAYAIDLTLTRRLANAQSTDEWLMIEPTTTQPTGTYDADWYTDWYSSTEQKPVDNSTGKNEWTYTYQKLLKYDENNHLYNFRITEDQVTGYNIPQYCSLSDYPNAADDDSNTTYTEKREIKTADDSNNNALETLYNGATVWNGLTPLAKTFEITNHLDTRDIKVYKIWDDGGNTDTHYTVDFTLNSTYVTGKDEHDDPVTQNYSDTKTAEIRTNETDEYAVFSDLPKYDKDGNVIVYHVSEKANTGGNNTGIFTVPSGATSFTLRGLAKDRYYKVVNAVTGDVLHTIPTDTETGTRDVEVTLSSVTAPLYLKVMYSTDGTTDSLLTNAAVELTQKTTDGNRTLTALPHFTEGTRQYGYAGYAEYAAASETIGNVEKVYPTAYYITNTLPLTYLKAQKSWNNKTDDSLNKYADSAIAVSL